MNRHRKKFNKGKWETERQRCQIADKEPPSDFQNAILISQVIPELMKRLGLEERHWERMLAEEWSRLMGAVVAAHTRPGRLTRDHLVVFVDSSVWLSELARFGKNQMLANLQQRFGKDKIKSISFQLDPGK